MIPPPPEFKPKILKKQKLLIRIETQNTENERIG